MTDAVCGLVRTGEEVRVQDDSPAAETGDHLALRTGADSALRTGVDVQSISSFRAQSDAVAEGIRDRAFTDAERAYCEGTRYPAQHYAARWAAKEAFVKLLDPDSSVQYWDVEVGKEGPRPVYELSASVADCLRRSCGVDDIHLDLSLTHDREADIAMAQAVARPVVGRSPRGERDG